MIKKATVYNFDCSNIDALLLRMPELEIVGLKHDDVIYQSYGIEKNGQQYFDCNGDIALLKFAIEEKKVSPKALTTEFNKRMKSAAVDVDQRQVRADIHAEFIKTTPPERKSFQIFFDIKRNLLFVESISKSENSLVKKMLSEICDQKITLFNPFAFPEETLRDWLRNDSAPAGIYLNNDLLIEDPDDEVKPRIKYKDFDIKSSDSVINLLNSCYVIKTLSVEVAGKFGFIVNGNDYSVKQVYMCTELEMEMTQNESIFDHLRVMRAFSEALNEYYDALSKHL